MVFDAVGSELISATFGALLAEGDSSGAGVSNNKVGSAIGAAVALATVGVASFPVTGIALTVGVLAGSKGEAVTKGALGIVARGTGALVGGAAKVTMGALGLAGSGAKSGSSIIANALRSEEARLEEGLILLRQGKYEKALKIFNRAVSKKETALLAYLYRAVLLASTKNRVAAIRDYSSALEIDSNVVAAYNSRGILFFQEQEYDRAIADFTNSITLAIEISQSI